MTADSRFVRHEPCDECGSKDNKGVWDDGHTYCFGCGHMTPSNKTVESLKNKVGNWMSNKLVPMSSGTSLDLSNYTFIIPKIAVVWLRKYGITDSEIKYHKLMWNIVTDSLVFPIYNKSGEIICTNERYFGTNSNYAKYITKGSKDPGLLITNEKYVKGAVIVVEDFVSAIKVSRQITASPLLGSTMPANRAKTLSERFKMLRVWLDMDKASESLRIGSRASQWIPDSSSIITEFDPKEYNDIEIANFIVKSIKKTPKPDSSENA